MMKKIIISVLSYILLLGVIWFLIKGNQALRVDRDSYAENYKAYATLYSASENEKRVFKLSLDQMKASKDSIFQKMLLMQKELRIKDKNIAQLQYRLSTAKRVDTLKLRDTIFVPDFKIDTVIGDKWFSQELHMEYPNTIISSPEITLENYVALNNKRETVKPRKKFFLWRWFQKRQTVTEVEVVEKNIYVKDSISRFVIINK